MNGLTITEIAEKLKIEYWTAKQRIMRAGIKPITKEAVYSNDVIEQIKDVKMGRPPKENKHKKLTKKIAKK